MIKDGVSQPSPWNAPPVLVPKDVVEVSILLYNELRWPAVEQDSFIPPPRKIWYLFIYPGGVDDVDDMERTRTKNL